MKKSLIFGLAAVTCAAWILVGCESPTNGEKGAAGANAPGTLPPDAKPELLAAYFASTDKVFLVADLDEGTFTVPAGKTLAVVGDVSLSQSTVIDAYDGTLDVSAGTIDGTGGTVVVIVAPAAAATVADKVSNASIPAYVASIPETITQITEDTLLGSLALGGEGTPVADLVNFAGTYTVYVKGTLAIDATTPLNTGTTKLVALGGATAKGTLTAGTNTKLGNLTASAALTLTGVSKADKLDTDTYTVTSTDTAVDLDSLDSGTDGKLVLTGNVTKVTITGGNGNIDFNTGTPAFGTASSFGNTGLTTFAKAAGSTNVALSFAGPVAFAGNFTRTTGGVYSFGGDVTITDTKKLTLGGTDTVTLAKGAAIKVAGTPATVLLSGAGEENVVITPVDGAVLTAKAGEIDVSTAGVEFGGDVVFGGDLTLTAAPATFDGTAFFADGKKITMTTGASIITLNEGALLAHGDATKIPAVYSAILAGYTDGATLTPANNTTLTFGANGTKSITQAGTAGHGITIGSNAALIPSATYTVASEAEKIGTLTVDTNATLIIIEGILGGDTGADNTAASAKLVLTGATETNGAKLTGAGSVVAGGATIVGGDDGWQAVGTGTVTIAVDAITASAATAVLTAKHANSAITVAGSTLAVTGGIKVGSSTGKVVLTGSATPGNIGKLLLKGGTVAGKLDLGNTGAQDVTIGSGTTNANFLIVPTGGSDDTDAKVTKADGTALAAATGIVVKAAGQDASSGSLLDYIAGGATANTTDVLISGPSEEENSTIISTHKVSVPST